MKRKYIFLYLLTFINSSFLSVACQHIKSSQAKEEVKDTLIVVEHLLKKTHNSDLIGTWRDERDESMNPLFTIKPDSISYFADLDEGQTCLLKTKKDSLFIYYTGWTYKASYKIDKGILIMQDASRVNKFLKIK